MLTKTIETAFAVGVMAPKQKRYEAEESFSELKSLLSTAGARVTHESLVEIRQFNPSTFVGHGKVEELKHKIQQLKPDVVVVDSELSPVQSRNLESEWQVRVVDRTGLILDIFAQQARSKEGKLQVELAQYQYLLPRLVRAWTHLSKQRGGAIGLRGPGETQLEVDRRRARERIVQLKKDLRKVSSSRQIHRQKRQSVPMPTISLIGYTNAGKSTLFNSLVKGGVIADDKLFSTLDPKTKKLRLPSGQQVLLSDTVGFIRNLPHELIESFKSTFEEVADSDLIIHVIDASHPNRSQHIETVELVLKELELTHIPVVKALNKIDRMDLHAAEALAGVFKGGSVRTAALSGAGLDDLLLKVEERLAQTYYKRMRLLIPYSQARALSELYEHGRVISLKSLPEGSEVDVSLPPKWQNIYKPFAIQSELDLVPSWAA